MGIGVGLAPPPAAAAALVTLFSVTDEELCADYWPDPHSSGACNCHSITNFGRVLRVAAGAKINSGRCENIGRSAIFGVPWQGHLNNGPICASVLRKIRDLHEMIARHYDFESRIVAGDDLAFKRIGESNCCCSQTNDAATRHRTASIFMIQQINTFFVSATEIRSRQPGLSRTLRRGRRRRTTQRLVQFQQRPFIQ